MIQSHVVNIPSILNNALNRLERLILIYEAFLKILRLNPATRIILITGKWRSHKTTWDLYFLFPNFTVCWVKRQNRPITIFSHNILPKCLLKDKRIYFLTGLLKPKISQWIWLANIHYRFSSSVLSCINLLLLT